VLEILAQPDLWIALVTLTAMEIVLGIDNIIFIAIIVARLPDEARERTRKLGLVLALVTRLLLLFALSWIMGLTEPLFTLPVLQHGMSGRDLILAVGGLFLIGKSAHEMYEKLEGPEVSDDAQPASPSKGNLSILLQIALLDIVFSLDSVITAVGMADDPSRPHWASLSVMVAAMLISVGVMLLFARSVSDFVERHPTMKVLALSFLLLIGVMLVAEGTGQHVSKGYIYFAMAFAVVVEVLNIRLRKVHANVKLHGAAPESVDDTHSS
jgi:predicted tellurium resistance membrane protein TerC